MLDKQGFDLWADHYDQTVKTSEDNNQYPFAGYKEILNIIFNISMQKPSSSVLDIGFGTAVLTSKLYENGHTIYGLDFSQEMMAIAQAKMPEAQLLEWDITKGMPPEFSGFRFDTVLSTYALHHLSDTEKVTFIKGLLPLLKQNGLIIIGDIAFQTREELNQCRAENLHHWDEEEFYFVFDELQTALENECRVTWKPISHCGGVIVISEK